MFERDYETNSNQQSVVSFFSVRKVVVKQENQASETRISFTPI